MIKVAQTDKDIQSCFSVMQQLRPGISEHTFIDTVKTMQAEGYHLAYLSEDETVKAVMGFKISHNLFLGRHLYIDDLVTDETSRSSGYGKQLIDWAYEKAKKAQCKAVHLDSGVQRHQAHKFYLNNNMDIVCYHFLKKL